MKLPYIGEPEEFEGIRVDYQAGTSPETTIIRSLVCRCGEELGSYGGFRHCRPCKVLIHERSLRALLHADQA